MAVTDDVAVEAAPGRQPAAPVPRASRKRRRGPVFTFGNLARLLALVALAAFLLYYVGPRDIAETALKVALAVALTVALWVGANLLFDQAYAHWTRFNTILGVVIGFVGYFIAEANGLLDTLFDDRVRFTGQGVFDDVTGWRTQPFDINGLLWGLIGGCALGLVMFLLSAPRRQVARFPLAVLGFTAFGLLTAWAVDESVWPAVRLDQAVDLRRCRRRRLRAHRAVAVRTRPCPAVDDHRGRLSAGPSARGAGATSAQAIGPGLLLRDGRARGDPRRPVRAHDRARRDRSVGGSTSAPAPGSSSHRRWRSSPWAFSFR